MCVAWQRSTGGAAKTKGFFMVVMAVTLLTHHSCRMRERDSTRVGSYEIRNSLSDAGNNMATAGVRLASPVVLAFGLAKV